MGSHGAGQSERNGEGIRRWLYSPIGLVLLAVVALAVGLAVGLLIPNLREEPTMPLALNDYQVRTEKLDGVVAFPPIYSVLTPVPESGRQCEPMQLAPIGNYSGIFVSDENGQIIQRSTIGNGVGNYSPTGSGGCEIRFSLNVPVRERYRVTAGYIAGAPPSYSVVVLPGERAQIEVPSP